ncbi:MAG: hypothetical protein GEV08_02915 [Acidimicrobiia bacterium]|nr:hypothetical protein [Acidimicrobiia bacterium]
MDFSKAADAQAVFNDSLLKAADLCGAADPPLRVQWKFSGSDEENPIAQEYIRGGYPSYIDCSTIQGGTPGSQLPGAGAQTSVTGGQAQDGG